MGNSSVCYEVIFLPTFVISFYFLIYKLFTHITWASIGTLKIDEKETSAGFCILVGADDQCTALCVALELAGDGWASLASGLTVVRLSHWTKLRNHTALFTASSHSATPWELAFRWSWCWGYRTERQRETGCVVISSRWWRDQTNPETSPTLCFQS